MKKLFIAAALALGLAGCSTAQFQAWSAKFQANLQLLTDDVNAVNQAIANVSTSLAKNCNTIHDTAESIDGLAKTFGANATTQGSIDAANAVIATWCTTPPSDIASAIKVTAAEVTAAKAAYDAARNGG